MAYTVIPPPRGTTATLELAHKGPLQRHFLGGQAVKSFVSKRQNSEIQKIPLVLLSLDMRSASGHGFYFGPASSPDPC